ncbi:MAG TPA: VOC family protein [Burkholderiaceae bacterium]
MTPANFLILYVADPAASVVFYDRLLKRVPVEASPGFAMYALDSGLMLGLWKRDAVLPAAAGQGCAAELCFPVAGVGAVQAAHARWRELGVTIAQEPVDLDFGHTFTAQDPDGHRLRVFHPAG